MFRRLTRAGAIAATLVVAASLAPAASAADGTWGAFDVPSIGSIVVQRDGGILETDCGNARIYRVWPAGAVSIFAGAGGGGFDNGYSGDGGPALDAHFGCVYGIIDDGAGGVLVADHLNDVIRRIDRRGIVSTVAGSGPRFTWSKGPGCQTSRKWATAGRRRTPCWMPRPASPRRIRQHVHRRSGPRRGPAGRRRRNDRDRSRDGPGRVLGRRRAGDQGEAEPSARGPALPRRRLPHGRREQRPRPQGSTLPDGSRRSPGPAASAAAAMAALRPLRPCRTSRTSR